MRDSNQAAYQQCIYLRNLSKQFSCIVAIVKDEMPFINEWLVYHRMLGVNHFFIYDDDPACPMSSFLRPHRQYVTVVPWYGMADQLPGRMNQVKAYIHAVVKFGSAFEWMGFLDIDEFVVLHSHSNLRDFLTTFTMADAVSLQWLVFGHNGYYDNPEGLVTASLTRRMYQPGRQVKTFSRPEAIACIESPHACQLVSGLCVDACGNPYNLQHCAEAVEVACIHHYQCRSFKQWMHRVTRGDVNFSLDNAPPSEWWRLREEDCLRQFVTTVALDKNEYVDTFMLKYKNDIESGIKALK